MNLGLLFKAGEPPEENSGVANATVTFFASVPVGMSMIFIADFTLQISD